MIYVILSPSGQFFPIAHHLQEEGADVLVCQPRAASDLGGVESWMTDRESATHRERRLSLYDNVLDKITVPRLWLELARLRKSRDEVFVLCEHGALWKLADEIRRLGFRGLLPTERDYRMEQDRQWAKAFVAKHYPDVRVAEVHRAATVDEAIRWIEEHPDEAWVVKSDGNHGDTIVPARDAGPLAQMETVHELREHASDYAKGALLIERKIPDAVEFAPVMTFWAGEPIASHVEIETRWLGAGDSGPQTGGNQTLIVRTPLRARINAIAFPPAAQEHAKAHRGMYLADCGLLADPIDGALYFSERAGAFSADTEMLTKRGWLTYREIALSDHALSVNPLTREIEWKPVTAFWCHRYRGPMVEVRSINALVTPDHEFWLDNGRKRRRARADRLPLWDWAIPRTGVWTGNPIAEVSLPPVDVYIEARTVKKGVFRRVGRGDRDVVMFTGRGLRPKRVAYGFRCRTLPGLSLKIADLCWLLGLWLAEGSFRGRKGKAPYELVISQSNKSRHRAAIAAGIKRLGLRYGVKPRGDFVVRSSRLARYFRDELGLAGTHADSKFVPQFFKELARPALRALVDGYMTGDGTLHKTQRVASTCSRRLADDLQEVIHKLGWVADVRRRPARGTTLTIAGRSYVRRHDQYVLSTLHVRIAALPEPRNVRRVAYDGIVWDVSVADNESLLVRRNGKAYFSSNCRWGYPGVFAEMAAGLEGGRQCAPYFEAVAAGRTPFRHAYAAAVSFYYLEPDPRHPALIADAEPIFVDGSERDLFLFQARRNRRTGQWESVGLAEDLVGAAVARGPDVETVARRAYATMRRVLLREMLVRPEEDFLSRAYSSAILNRLAFFEKRRLLDTGSGASEDAGPLT